MKKHIPIFLLLIISSCTPIAKQGAESMDYYGQLPDYFTTVLKAHGGLEKWKSFGTLEYDLQHENDSIPTEHYILDLKNRKDLTVADSFKIGFNGEQVWVAPKKSAFKGRSARFYHNLYSYFLSIPFIVADPGIKYESDTITVDTKKYEVIRISFEKGIGDADQDYYKMLIDPSTHRMEMLLYTVTYFSGEAHENFNALSYEDFEEVNGMLLPTKLVGYKYAEGKTGDKRYEVSFKNITFKTESPDQTLFEIPNQAEIDSLVRS